MAFTGLCSGSKLIQMNEWGAARTPVLKNQSIPRSAYSSAAARPPLSVDYGLSWRALSVNQQRISIPMWKCMTSVPYKSCTHLGQAKTQSLSSVLPHLLYVMCRDSVCVFFSWWAFIDARGENPKILFPMGTNYRQFEEVFIKHMWTHSNTHDPEPRHRLNHHLLS